MKNQMAEVFDRDIEDLGVRSLSDLSPELNT